MAVGRADEPAVIEVDVLVVGLGPGGCVAALTAHAQGLSTMAVEARSPEATRMRLVLVRPRAQELLRGLGLGDITQGRRSSTIKAVEQGLRQRLVETAAAGPATPLSVAWHTRVATVEDTGQRVRVTLRDGIDGQQRTIAARHVVDATGGRLEPLGRPVRKQVGPRHVVVTAEFETPPWFDGIVGARDVDTRDALILVPMHGRLGVTAYLDTAPGIATDNEVLLRRFDTIAARLALVRPRQEPVAIDVVQRVLAQASRDRVVPIGDSAGTVDLWIGAGMSTAIEDAHDAACGIAAAQREASPGAELARTLDASRRVLARHRSRMRLGRLMVMARPLLLRLLPALPMQDVHREAVRCPPGLWQGMRLVAGRRPPRQA